MLLVELYFGLYVCVCVRAPRFPKLSLKKA